MIANSNDFFISDISGVPNYPTTSGSQVFINNGTMNFTTSTNNVNINQIVEKIFPDIRENENHPAHYLTEKQKEFLQKATTLDGIDRGLYVSLPKIETILKSVCMISGIGWDKTKSKKVPFVGTGFLGKLFNSDGTPSCIVYMSVGHNFEEILQENMNPDCLRQFKINFGNLSGDLPYSRSWSEHGRKVSYNPNSFMKEDLHSLLEPFKFCGSISCKGKRVLFKDGKCVYYQPRNGEVAFIEDYCMLQLSGQVSEVEEALKKKGLEALPVGRNDYLEPKNGELVCIFGHPNVGQGKYPLRLSFGTEREFSCLHSSNGKKLSNDQMKNYLPYDIDTFPGNSGSPVIGRAGNDQGYSVKGIHVRAFKECQTNGAQKIIRYQEWIDAGKNFTPTNRNKL